jgi:hypothetical protein
MIRILAAATRKIESGRIGATKRGECALSSCCFATEACASVTPWVARLNAFRTEKSGCIRRKPPACLLSAARVRGKGARTCSETQRAILVLGWPRNARDVAQKVDRIARGIVQRCQGERRTRASVPRYLRRRTLTERSIDRERAGVSRSCQRAGYRAALLALGARAAGTSRSGRKTKLGARSAGATRNEGYTRGTQKQ